MTLTQTLDHRATAETWDSMWQRASPDWSDRRLDLERAGRRWQLFRDELNVVGEGLPMRCVELGAGEGDFSVLLAEAGHEVTLVDFSDEALARARARFDRLGLNATFERADLFAFSEEQRGCFDVSLSLGVAEHFSGTARRSIVAAHRRVLRPGGIGLISVPNACCGPYRLWKAFRQLRGTWHYGFEQPFTPWGLRRAARQTGFTGARTYNTGFAASVDGCLLKLLTGRRRGWGDGPRWANAISGWSVNMIGRAA